MRAAATFFARSLQGAVAHNAIEPGERIARMFGLFDQLDKCFLDDVFRRKAPLPR